ncbi:MAG: type II toxin-antitoxin system prevent-host-death family antitoxin [Candidatus Electrothrix sp. AUS3]|nr:type II toxin-antitoxin system prevent-host-death family antitoxin [Candidatus Electrothrix gigas]
MEKYCKQGEMMISDKSYKSYSMKQASRQLKNIVSFVERGHSVGLTRNGEPIAMLVSVAEYQALRSLPKQDFWGALKEFRCRYADEPDDCQEVFSGIRETSPGRDVSW